MNHRCITDEGWACINAEIYGPCTSDTCEGVCSYKGDCTCPCGHPAEEYELYDLPLEGEDDDA